MSFILDALKKSETDRQQQSSAEFAAVPSSTAPAAIPRWLWVVGGLLAINLAVLVGVLLQPDSIPPPQNNAQPVTTPLSGNTLQSDTLQPDTPQPSSFESKVAAARENAPLQQQDTSVAKSPAINPDALQPDLISQNPSAIPAYDLYPTIHEVRAKGLLEIPDLHLDIHVYNAAPEDRFVFINMAKLREGSQLAEGPVVAEIAPEGVVLRHHDQLFLLPRE